MPTSDPVNFGCPHCWPASPDAAWQATRTHRNHAVLIEESHFRVTIKVCTACAQNFVSVFTETIDWVDGEDPQYWIVLPLTQSEADELAANTSTLTEAQLSALGRERRCLLRDFPKGADPEAHWGTGVSIRRHD